MACKNYNVIINQLDLNNASNNSDPDLDGKVFVSYTDCNGNPESIAYSTAGTYLNAFCADDNDIVTAIYWFDDIGALSFRSTATPISDCVAPTPTPSVTPSFSVTPTPSTTPLNVCNCISFTNITTGSLKIGYTLCDGSSSPLVKVNPNSTIVVCGNNPGSTAGIIVDILGTCVGNSCVPFTPTPTPSLSITPTISVTPSITPSNTPSISITPSNTPSISVTPSITPSNTVPPSMTPTPTISVSKTPSITPLPSVSKTPSISVTPSITPSTGTSPTPTPTISPSGFLPDVDGLCMTIKFGSAPSVTPSATPSATPSVTPTITPSVTPTVTPTSTNPPPTPSRTPSKTPSITVSTTPSRTPSVTPSITPSTSIPAINCASCNVQALPNNGNGSITNGNLTVNTTYTGPTLYNTGTSPLIVGNCTSFGRPFNTILLGFNPGSFTYTLNFNQPVNNIKILMDGGGLVSQQGAIETYTFNTNNGTPTLSLCGPSCSTTTNGNTVSLTMTNSIPGAALIQASASNPYTQLTITGLGQLQGVNTSICLDTAVPLPSPTPSRTPSTSPGFATSCNTILYRTQNKQYYSYNFTTNASTLLNVAPNPYPILDGNNGVPITLAHTNNKSWVYAWDDATNAVVIRESNITLSPFTSTFNRNIALPAGYTPANGLVAINDTTLVGINKVQYLGTVQGNINAIKDEYFVVEYDILGTTAISTVKFKTPQFKKPVGGFIRTTGSSPKIIMLTQPDYAPGSNLFLSQYNYNTGQLEVLQQLTQPASPNNTGLVTANGNLYIMGFNVYKINNTAPYATTFIQSPGTQLINASQLPSCSNVTLIPTTCYGGLPPINVPNTVTYNGITISATGTGAVTQMWDVSYNTCTSTSTPVSPNSVLLGGKWQAAPGVPTNFSYTMNFSQPVSNVGFLMAAMDGPLLQSPESFTFTSNGGAVSVSSNNNCFSSINGNVITALGGNTGAKGAGKFIVSAPTSFTQLTVTGPGGLGGTLMSIDCENLFPAQIVNPSPTPTPTPSISSGTPTLGCVYYYQAGYLYNYDTLTNTSSSPIALPNLGAGVYAQNDTHTPTRYFKSNNTNLIQEWVPTNNPTTLAFSRNISVNTGYFSFFYSFAIDNNTLIAVGSNTPAGATTGIVEAKLIRIDISGNTVTPAQVTTLFDVGFPNTSIGFGNMLLTSTNKLLYIGTKFNGPPITGIITWLRQYSYPDGALELEIDLAPYVPFDSTYGNYSNVFESNGNIYFTYALKPNLTTTNVYRIDSNSPYPVTLVGTVPGNTQLWNSSFNCNTTNFTVAPSPTPGLSPTPTPSLTPPLSPNVGINTIYKYLDIL